VFAGLDEAALVTRLPSSDPDAQTSALRALGPNEVIIKLGAAGAHARVGSSSIAVPAIPVTVVDTVGAGNASVAGYLSETLAGAPPSTFSQPQSSREPQRARSPATGRARSAASSLRPSLAAAATATSPSSADQSYLTAPPVAPAATNRCASSSSAIAGMEANTEVAMTALQSVWSAPR